MDIREVSGGDVKLVELVLDKVQLWDFVTMATNVVSYEHVGCYEL
jgi:hypothetical protein